MPMIRNPRATAAAVHAEIGVTSAAYTAARTAIMAHLDGLASARQVEQNDILALPEVQAIAAGKRADVVRQILAEL